jgi:hypothetical protein
MPASKKTEAERAETVGLPARSFLYTLDQISQLTSIDVPTLKKSYIYYENRSIGRQERYLLSARNIAPPEEKPEWRVSEREFIRWMRYKGYKYYDRGYYV